MTATVKIEQALLRIGRRGTLAIDRFTLQPGEHWTVLGGNGSGKSLLAALASGKRRESGNYVHTIDGFEGGRDVCPVSFEEQQRLWALDARHDISEYSESAFDAGTQVTSCIRQQRSGDEQDEAWLQQICQALDLQQFAERGIRYLSSGQLRRVMIARALYTQSPHRPTLLVFDDPLESLDRQSRGPIAECIDAFMLPISTSLRLTRRVSDILPGTTHLALMERTGDAMTMVAQGELAAMQAGPDYARFCQRRPTIPETFPEALRAPPQPPEDTPLIELRRVSASYGEHRVLDRLDWVMSPTDHVLVEGPNGCGKSTLLSLIDGENHKGYGQDLYLFGQRKGSGESVWEIKRRFGVVSNELHARYIAGWRVLEVVLSGYFDSVGLYDDAGSREREQARQWIALMGLGEKVRHYYHELSFGEQRLVLLARAMVKQPRVLVLDEPCVGLDDYHRALILGLLDLIAGNARTQLIYVSHTRGEHPKCCNQRLEFVATGESQYGVQQSTM